MAKILLIDDDPDVRKLLGDLLEKEGYEVQTASGKEEAWIKLNSDKPAVILLDVLLSGADGRELCREIKSDSKMKDVTVIMLSGHPSAAQKFESYGADDFIAKPVATDALLEKLKEKAKV